MSRVVTATKKHAFHVACSADFSKVFRRVDDSGPVRKKPTPTSEEIFKNLNQFEAKWKAVTLEDRPRLTEKALEEIKKTRDAYK